MSIGHLSETNADPDPVDHLIVGASPLINSLRGEIRHLAERRFCSLLVTGETGVGKDLVARALAGYRPKLYKHLEVFNCPAIPVDHLESELFGTTKGAYPGALDRQGIAERSAGGLLFFDEIGAMRLDHQAKILRLLESGEGRRLGSARTYSVAGSTISATNENLVTLCEDKRFRWDLYYRLVQDGTIHVPPLRERREDIPLLLSRLIPEDAKRFSGEGILTLMDYDWPGNVRELRAVARTTSRLCPDGDLMGWHVRQAIQRIREPMAGARPVHIPNETEINSKVVRERAAIVFSLSRYHGRLAPVARDLGVSVRTVQRRIQGYGLCRTNFLRLRDASTE